MFNNSLYHCPTAFRKMSETMIKFLPKNKRYLSSPSRILNHKTRAIGSDHKEVKKGGKSDERKTKSGIF